MFAVYESINLGLFDPPKGAVASTSTALAIVRAPTTSQPQQQVHPTFVLDPLRVDRVFITHSRGVHRLDMRGWVSNIAKVLKGNNQEIADALRVGDKQEGLTEVRWLLRTENRYVTTAMNYRCQLITFHSAIIAASILNDVYLAYALLALDSAHSLKAFELAAAPVVPPPRAARKLLPAPAAVPSPPRPAALSSFVSFTPAQPTLAAPPQSYASLLTTPFQCPNLPRYQPLTKPLSATGAVTADTLRSLGKHAERLRIDMASIQSAHQQLLVRTNIQLQETRRQVERLAEMVQMIGRVRSAASRTTERVRQVAEKQGEMVKRADMMLRKVVEAEGGEGSAEAQATWGKELARMKVDIRGVNGEGGLKARSEQVRVSWSARW